MARDEADLYDYIRRHQLGDETVRVISDRRRSDRRQRMEVDVPDRRRAERRQHSVDLLLRRIGWAEVALPEA